MPHCNDIYECVGKKCRCNCSWCRHANKPDGRNLIIPVMIGALAGKQHYFIFYIMILCIKLDKLRSLYNV